MDVAGRKRTTAEAAMGEVGVERTMGGQTRSVSGMFVDPIPISELFVLKVEEIICCRYY